MQKAEWHIEVVLCRFQFSIITYSFHLTTRAFHTRPCKSTVCVLFRVKYGKGLIRNKHSSTKDYFSTIACTLFYQQSHLKKLLCEKEIDSSFSYLLFTCKPFSFTFFTKFTNKNVYHSWENEHMVLFSFQKLYSLVFIFWCFEPINFTMCLLCNYCLLHLTDVFK